MRKLSNYIISPDGKLYHANYKYIKRDWKNGRWRYTYPEDPEAEKVKVPDPPKFESLFSKSRMDPELYKWYPDVFADYAKESIDEYNQLYKEIKEQLVPTEKKPAQTVDRHSLNKYSLKEKQIGEPDLSGLGVYKPITGESLGPSTSSTKPTRSEKGHAANEKRKQEKLQKIKESAEKSNREYQELYKKQSEQLNSQKESNGSTEKTGIRDRVDKAIDKGKDFVENLFSGKKKKKR